MALKNECSAQQGECPQASQAADAAVKKVFAILGVDIDKPESVEEFREDLRFGKKLRRVADHSLLALFGVVMAGLAAAVWAGIVQNITRGD
jgi:hypothetical protein